MAESLVELLLADPGNPVPQDVARQINDPSSLDYLSHLSTLPLSSLASSEAQSLAQSSHQLLLSLQALSTRSHKSVTTAARHWSTLEHSLPSLAKDAQRLKDAIPQLDEAASRFAQSYSKSAENGLLDRRKKAMLLARNVDRLSDILELPTLLSTAISASSPAAGLSATSAQAVGSSMGTSSYSSALDLYLHIKRLHSLYPRSPLVSGLLTRADEAMERMTENLIAGLRAPGLKLAAAMRMISWLRRVAPDLNDETSSASAGIRGGHNAGGGLGALFLVCRLANLTSMIAALEPLRELADQESSARIQRRDSKRSTGTSRSNESAWSNGQHTERYLKRYIEIFREQSFAILSMFRSIFPPSKPGNPGDDFSRTNEVSLGKPRTAESLESPERTDEQVEPGEPAKDGEGDPLHPLPSPLSTMVLHLVNLLVNTLKHYMVNVQDGAARESLLTQVLYCASSLGRLGADFGMLLALLDLTGSDVANGSVDPGQGQDTSVEWATVMKKHRALAGRLDLLASGLGSQEHPTLPSRRKV
ncbi:MAG: hypothetical protein M1826_003159 [Phylliscum demangeonii]|nr:MAG: hypothetical protein M1826_003159 [Phylliscum demangeonii]